MRDNCDVAVAVGPQQRHPEACHLVEQHRRRMAIVVVQPHAHDGHRRVHRCQEVGIGVGGAVVRHLQHVRAQIGT